MKSEKNLNDCFVHFGFYQLKDKPRSTHELVVEDAHTVHIRKVTNATCLPPDTAPPTRPAHVSPTPG